MSDVAEAVKLMQGREPWALGHCFDATMHVLMFRFRTLPKGLRNVRLCHGDGIANLPGQEGNRMAHAWIEADHPERGRIALDVIWRVYQPVDVYRRGQRAQLVLEYTPRQAFFLWALFNMPGPWDPRLREITEAVDARISQPAATNPRRKRAAERKDEAR